MIISLGDALNFFLKKYKKALDFENQKCYIMGVEQKGCNMEQIIKNEIYKLIKRFPSEEELQSAIDYLDGCADDLTTAKDIPGLVEDWLSDKMTQCEYCGAWCLRSEMYEYNYSWFCDETCCNEANEGLDMREEARAEYEALNR